jgi:hypothetical protein
MEQIGIESALHSFLIAFQSQKLKSILRLFGCGDCVEYGKQQEEADD